MKAKRFNEENCKTEADFYGCLAPSTCIHNFSWVLEHTREAESSPIRYIIEIK